MLSKNRFVQDGPGWSTLAVEPGFESPHLSVATYHVLTPSRRDPARAVSWTVAHRRAAVVVAPVTASGHFVLVRQERVPVRATIWEFPAGQIDEEDRSTDDAVIRATALRELREEAGYEFAPPAGPDAVADGAAADAAAAGAARLRPLGHLLTSPGFTDEHCYLFLARPVVPVPGGNRPEGAEVITECRLFSPADLRRMIADGEISDANTLAAFARLVASGLGAF